MLDITKEVVNRLKDNVNKIILFGSYAKGNFTSSSDLDLLIVTDDEFIPKDYEQKSKIYLQISKKIRDLRKFISIDLLVLTNAMYEEFIKSNSSFAKELQNEGKILWQKQV